MHERTGSHIRHLAAALIAAMTALTALFIGAAPASAASHHITISTYAYHPGALTVAVGDTVTWTNLDSVAHDVTVTRGPALFHSPMLSQGQSWSYTFTVAGPYNYICSVHPDMTATLTVTPAAQSAVPTGSTHAAASGSERRHGRTPAVTPTQTAAPITAQTQTAPLDSAAQQTQINPLLLVGGALCAVLIFCLLTIASRPVQPAVLSHQVSGDESPTRVLPPPPPV